PGGARRPVLRARLARTPGGRTAGPRAGRLPGAHAGDDELREGGVGGRVVQARLRLDLAAVDGLHDLARDGADEGRVRARRRLADEPLHAADGVARVLLVDLAGGREGVEVGE